MSALAYVPLAVALLAFLTSGRVGRTLPPGAFVKLGTALALTVALMTGLVLSVAAALSLRTLQGAGRTSFAAAGREATSLPTAAGIAAAGIVTVLLGCAARHFLRSVRALVRTSSDSRRLGPVHSGLLVVDDTLPTAFAVAGAPGHVVVSTAMLQALDPGERRALLAHEAAHLRHHHHLYVQLARLAAAANPLLRPLARAIGRNTERWADEVAADEIGDRELVARGLARAALARQAHREPAAFRATGRFAQPPMTRDVLRASGDDEGQLGLRVRSLLEPAPRRAGLTSAVVIALALGCATAGSVAAIQGHQQIERTELSWTQVGPQN